MQTPHLHFTGTTVCVLLDELVGTRRVRTSERWLDAVLVEHVDVGFETVAFVVRVGFDGNTDERSHGGWLWSSIWLLREEVKDVWARSITSYQER